MKIALVAPPWPLFNRPSIQIAALKSFLLQELRGVEARCFHPYLAVAAGLGADDYDLISQSSWASEAVGASLLEPANSLPEALFFQALKDRGLKVEKGLFPRAKSALEHALKRLVEEELPQADLLVVTASINQLTAALALAQYSKRSRPERPIILGGAGVSGPFGDWIETTFPEIDLVIMGEGELPLVEAVSALAEGRPLKAARGQLPSLGRLPIPDYSDFFQELYHLPGPLRFIPVLPVEASRGCWWNRCNFCNLNLQWKGYRAKEPRRVVEEVAALASRHGVLDFAFMDNVLPRREAVEIFRLLGRTRLHLHIFAEIRAVYRRDQVRNMAQGGLVEAQVGIEALSTSLLKRLGKGTTLMDNVAAMRHLTENGIRLGANLMLHFPGSSHIEVKETLEALKFVWPYQPLKPVSFWLGDGSPVAAHPKRFGIYGLRPHRFYQHLFPGHRLEGMRGLVMEYRGDLTVQRTLWEPVQRRLEEWAEQYERLTRHHPRLLSFRDGKEFLLIRQVMPDGQVFHHRLPSLARSIYLSCLDPRPIKEVVEAFPQQPAHRLVQWLNSMIEKRLMMASDDKVIGLAIEERSDRVRDAM